MKDTDMRSNEERILDLELFRAETRGKIVEMEDYIILLREMNEKISKITFTILGMFTSMNIIFISMTFLKGLPLSVILISAFLLLGLNLIYLIR